MAGERCRGTLGLLLAASLLLPAVVSCGGGTEAPPSPEPVLAPAPDAEGRRWIDETLDGLTLREAVGQLVIPWIPGAYASTSSEDFRELEATVEQGVGGLSISIGLPHSYAAKLNALQRRAKVPLLVTSDFESGGPGMRINHAYALPSLLPQGGGTSFPPTMAFGAIGEERFARTLGRITAEEARAVGVHLNFAPVVDVNNNPANPVINTRAFGEDPEAVARLGAAFIRGSREGGALTTAKHFPGHGDTGTDSHIELPVIPADRARLERLELVPFRRAVDVGVDAVMTAHVAVPEILGEGAPPATFSPFFLTDLLREEMGFEGVVLTDALRMGAITEGYGAGEAAVRAVEAGSDVILAPADVETAIDAVVRAVESGRLSRERIERSARRILTLKTRVGLHRSRTVDLGRVDRVVGSGPHLAFADSAASRSMTLVRDRDELVPMGPDDGRRVLSLTYARERELTAGGTVNALLAGGVDEVDPVRVGAGAPPLAFDTLWNRAWRADRVVVGSYMPPRSGSGSVDVDEAFSAFVRKLAVHRPTVLAAFGSPYVLRSTPEVGSYLVAWGDREVSQAAAVRALLGREPIGGTLPVSIPPLHDLGDGLARDALPERERPTERRDPLAEAGILPEEEGGEAGEGEAGTVTSGARGVSMVASAAETSAEEAGMSAASLARLDTLVLEAVADSAAPGAALAVARRGKLVRLRGYGRTDWSEDAPPATPTTLYDLASLTKVVATTTAAMILVDEGRMELDAPVVRYLPWWSAGDPRKEDVTVRQLLLHRAGLPPYRRFFLEMDGRAAYERAIGGLELEYAPGDSTVYSDIGLMTVAFAVEEIAGRPLDDFVRDRVWRPLGMGDTDFRPDPALVGRIAPTEVDTLYRERHVHGAVHDENAYAIGGVAGHAGLFSTAADLVAFGQAMLEGGELEPCAGPPASSVACIVPGATAGRLIDREVVERFTRRRDETSSRALGWDTPSGRSSAGDYFGRRSFGHTGFTGTSIWVEPELELVVVLLTNRVNPTRENRKHVPLRRAVHDAAATAITDRPVEKRER